MPNEYKDFEQPLVAVVRSRTGGTAEAVIADGSSQFCDKVIIAAFPFDQALPEAAVNEAVGKLNDELARSESHDVDWAAVSRTNETLQKWSVTRNVTLGYLQGMCFDKNGVLVEPDKWDEELDQFVFRSLEDNTPDASVELAAAAAQDWQEWEPLGPGEDIYPGMEEDLKERLGDFLQQSWEADSEKTKEALAEIIPEMQAKPESFQSLGEFSKKGLKELLGELHSQDVGKRRGRGR